jgi:hypothetical protein
LGGSRLSTAGGSKIRREESVRHRKLAALLALSTTMVAALLAASSAFAWQVTMTANPKLKRSYTWTIDKTVSQSAVTLKAGETADVTYTVTATPSAGVDSDWGVDGVVDIASDPLLDIASLQVYVTLDPSTDNRFGIPATIACVPTPFPVDLNLVGLKCDYSAALPDTTWNQANMRATLVPNPSGVTTRTAQKDFSWANANVNLVDESVTLTDSMTGALGTANAADGPKTITYTKTIGPFTAAECGTKTIDNTAAFTTVDTGATASDTASVDVTITCPPPAPKCPLPSLIWKFVALIGPNYVKTLLPQTLGTAGGSKSVSVTSTTQAMSILFKEWTSSNVVDLLSAELLAAKLNQASGRDVSSIASTIAAADAFLATKNASSSLSSSEKTMVKGWTAKLEEYNNKCFDIDLHCGKHWNKPDKDWHKWNWKKFDWDD